MKEKFFIEMTKDEMLRFYANKIVEDGIKGCRDFNNKISLIDYNKNNINLQEYKNEILQLLYKDERISDVIIDEELNIDMIFYIDFCPFYYNDEKSIKYEITDSPTYQGIVLVEFIDYMEKRIFEESYISVRNLINHFVQEEQRNKEIKSKLYNFLKKSIIETGFVDKYVENIDIYVTYKNYKELKEGLTQRVNMLDKEIEKSMRAEEEFE